MWQNWQNKILREAAKYGYKSEEAEFYEQELNEQEKVVKGVTFRPFKAGRMTGWNVYGPKGDKATPVGFLEKGVSTKTTTTPTKLRVMDKDSVYGASYNKLVLQFWPASKVSGVSIPPSSGQVTNITGDPKKMLDMIADWILKNSDKI